MEGVLNRALAALEQDQARRREEHPEDATEVQGFVEKLRRLKEVDSPFSMVRRYFNPTAAPPAPSTRNRAVGANCQLLLFLDLLLSTAF